MDSHEAIDVVIPRQDLVNVFWGYLCIYFKDGLASLIYVLIRRVKTEMSFTFAKS